MGLVRSLLRDRARPGANPTKYRHFLRGETASYILVRTHPKDGGGYDKGVTWVPEKDLVEKYLKWDHAMIVINVKLVMSPHVE